MRGVDRAADAPDPRDAAAPPEADIEPFPGAARAVRDAVVIVRHGVLTEGRHPRAALRVAERVDKGAGVATRLLDAVALAPREPVPRQRVDQVPFHDRLPDRAAAAGLGRRQWRVVDEHAAP